MCYDGLKKIDQNKNNSALYFANISLGEEPQILSISVKVINLLILIFNHELPLPQFKKNTIICRDAEILLNKQVKFKNLKINASPDNEICSNILYFMPVRRILCQSKQADLLFSASVHLCGFYCPR